MQPLSIHFDIFWKAVHFPLPLWLVHSLKHYFDYIILCGSHHGANFFTLLFFCPFSSITLFASSSRSPLPLSIAPLTSRVPSAMPFAYSATLPPLIASAPLSWILAQPSSTPQWGAQDWWGVARPRRVPKQPRGRRSYHDDELEQILSYLDLQMA